MKRLIAGLVAGAVLATAGAGIAAKSGLVWFARAGVTCAYGVGPQGRGAACSKTDGKGYGVTVTGKKVLVWNANGKIVFARAQPK